MAFAGDFVTEHPTFKTDKEAWEYAGDIGSKWYFYPYPFVVTDSEITVKEAPDGLEFLNGWRVKKVAEFFKRVAALPEAQNAAVDKFVWLLQENV